MVSDAFHIVLIDKLLTNPGSRGPAVLDDFTASYGYKFSDPAGYQWTGANHDSQNKL